MAVAIPVVDGEVILRRILKGDPSMSSSWSLMESALWVIATPARVTALVTSAPAPPPPPRRMNGLKNPPPPALIVNALGYVSGYFLEGLAPTGEIVKVICLKLKCQ